MAQETVRFNFAISVENNNWLEKQADNLGMSKAAYLNMCISKDREEKMAIQMFQQIGDMNEFMEKVAKAIEATKAEK